MTQEINSFKYLDPGTSQVVKAWIAREQFTEIPWTPLTKPLDQCRVALISSAGITLKEDPPFDQQTERENPWWGDPSYRKIPRESTADQVELHHLHINTKPGAEDLDCVLPLRRLDELCKAGMVGQSAPSHYSFMGYLLRPETFLRESVPRMIEQMLAEEVDLCLLVPV